MNVNCVDLSNRTAILAASSKSWVSGVIQLLKKGANVNIASNEGRTPIYVGASEGCVEVVKLLLEKGADLTVADKDGWAPLNSASDSGHIEVVKVLLEKGADLTVANKNGLTPLIRALGNGHDKIVSLLLAQHNVDLQSSDANGRTALSWAAAKGHKSVIELLIADKRFDGNSQDYTGLALLMWASQKSQDSVYNGTLDSPTDPFRFLRSLRETSVKEPVAFTVSVSIPLSGPIQMANVVEHVLRSRYLQGQEERIGGVDDAQSLRVAQTNYEYLIDNLNRLTDEKTKRAIRTRQEALYKLEKELAPCLLMARRPADTFRGKPIGEGSREITVEHINCPMGDGLAQGAFRRITAEVQSYVQHLLQEKKQKWNQDGRRGLEPTQRSIEASLFGSGEDNNIAVRMNHKSKKAWIRLIRAGVP
ncbi:hypothetical protein NPX13_g11134 [Xylaria arbuscula]|uniref:Uncharacterized protein n=1 Tax=Xylaria arbuscula TaxID=114810 RepID=A0A9W8TH81_9PEZI|nr:hypothetical protein NPX13_g11134 [Xylaria arbuscula]